MTKYELPPGLRYSTLKEREKFYASEFKLDKVAQWIKDWPGKINFAVIMGRHTRIFQEKYKKDSDTTIIIDEYSDLKDVRQQIIDFLPEAVYYDRNVYENKIKVGQELAFDLDPENITCPIHGTLADKMARKQGLSFCKIELDLVKQETTRLYEYLQDRFSSLRIVYSGRGFHIHVLSPEAYKLSPGRRQEIAKEIKSKGFQIDEWVTTGEMRLIRLPFSLNGLVSRIVLPLTINELEGFDPISDERCLPKFLDEQATSS